jgi:pSer/pThr/pTyr-binding forkhead associated (FHA) protein
VADAPLAQAHASTPAELQARLELERRAVPFVLHRDGEGRQVLTELAGRAGRITIGRRAGSDLALTWDAEVSRVHAQLEPVGQADWVLVDDGLSRNGSFVNGERVSGRRRLRDGDRLCFGTTRMLFRLPDQEVSVSTAVVGLSRGSVPVTETQRRVLVALCRPVAESAYAAPAANREIADEVHLSVDAVKAHLRVLFERLGLDDLPQNAKRARLAALALVNGLVQPHDF